MTRTIEEVIESTRGIVLNCIRRHLNSDFYYAIDDVSQEVYIRLAKHLRKFESMGQRERINYVYTITKNECHRMNKRLWRQGAKEDDFANSFYYDMLKGNSLDDAMILDLQIAIHELPAELRMIFEKLLEGYKIREIADFFSIPLGTVKSRLSNGKKRLRLQLSEGEANE